MTFACSSAAMAVFPVTLPPGCAKLAIRPVATGSPTPVMTIGISFVACFAACAGGVCQATMMSTLRRRFGSQAIKCACVFACRSELQSDVLFLGIAEIAQPPECRQEGCGSGFPRTRMPIVCGVAVCWERAASGQVAAAPPNREMNSRRFIVPLQAEGRILPHRGVRTLQCIAAKLIVEWQRWAKNGYGDQRRMIT